MKELYHFVLPHFSSSEPQNAIECQVAKEDLEARTYGQMIKDDSLPFYSESVQFLKGNLHNLSVKKDEQF